MVIWNKKKKFWRKIKKRLPFFWKDLLEYLFSPSLFKIAIIGEKGAGKTTYITLLYHYLREKMGREWNSVAENRKTSLFLSETLKKIRQGNLEESQSHHSLHLALSFAKENISRTFSIEIQDISGKFLKNSRFMSTLEDCDGIIYMIDPRTITEEEKFTLQEILWKLKNNQSIPYIAIVFSKIDIPDTPSLLKDDLPSHLEFSDKDFFQERAKYFAREKIPGVYKMVQKKFPVNFFSISSFGDWLKIENSSGKKVFIPDPDKPSIGLHLPIQWIYDSIWEQRKITFYGRIFRFLGLLFLTGFLFFLVTLLFPS